MTLYLIILYVLVIILNKVFSIHPQLETYANYCKKKKYEIYDLVSHHSLRFSYHTK